MEKQYLFPHPFHTLANRVGGSELYDSQSRISLSDLLLYVNIKIKQHSSEELSPSKSVAHKPRVRVLSLVECSTDFFHRQLDSY